MTTTVEVLAAAFKDAGTPFIVGHPGGESVELMEAARQRQMRFLLMKQEVAGAMLAATWGDITGSPGSACRRAALAQPTWSTAWRTPFSTARRSSRSPIPIRRPTYETGLRQRINQLALYEPIVKWSTTIDAKTVRQQVRRAIRTATGDAARARCISSFRRARRRARPATTPPSRRCVPNWIVPGPDRADLKPALDMLGKARRPILIAGLGVLLVRGIGRIRRIRRAPRRAGADHHEMQGHDPGGSPVAGGLHHRRADRAQAGDGVRPDRHGRSRRGGAAAEAVALYAAGAGAVLDPERRRAGACRPGDHRQPEGAAGRRSRDGRRKAPIGARRPPRTFRQRGSRRAQYAEHRPVAAADDGGRARGAAARHDRHLRCRRQPAAGRAEMGILRTARIPDLQWARLHGLCGARRAGGTHRPSGSPGRRFHRRWRFPDDGRGTADGSAREPAHHRSRVR